MELEVSITFVKSHGIDCGGERERGGELSARERKKIAHDHDGRVFTSRELERLARVKLTSRPIVGLGSDSVARLLRESRRREERGRFQDKMDEHIRRISGNVRGAQFIFQQPRADTHVNTHGTNVPLGSPGSPSS